MCIHHTRNLASCCAWCKFAAGIVGSKLQVDVELATWQVAVNKGFTPGASFRATLSGSGDLFLLGLNATDLTLTNNGCAGIFSASTVWHVTQWAWRTGVEQLTSMTSICRAL